MIYNGEIEATKIPIEWYSWMHSIKNKIEETHDLKKYHWQKNHLSNQTGTDKAYNPQKIRMLTKKNIIPGIIVKIIFLIILSFETSFSDENNSIFVEINILDKVSSKNTILKLKLGEEKKYQNLSIKVLKCENSKFDDDPEITAYIQVKDLNISDNEKVFIFNGWTFSSSPTVNPFDHPVYDLWLSSCKII